MSPLNLAFGAIAIAAVVMPVMTPTRKTSPEYETLVKAFEEKGATLERSTSANDVYDYAVAAKGCVAPGRLIMAGYGSRQEVQDRGEKLSADRKMYFSGHPVDSVENGALRRRYIFDQVLSKFGFIDESPWSRRIVIFDAPSGCEATWSLAWHADGQPDVAVGAH